MSPRLGRGPRLGDIASFFFVLVGQTYYSSAKTFTLPRLEIIFSSRSLSGRLYAVFSYLQSAIGLNIAMDTFRPINLNDSTINLTN